MIDMLFNTSQKFILIKDLSPEINFDLINEEFDKLNFKSNIKNQISIEMDFFEKDYLTGAKNSIIKNCENYINHTLNIQQFYTGLKMTHSWGNVTQPGQGHHEHVHPFSVVSGVIFLDNNPCNLNLFIEAYMPDIPYFITKNRSYVSLRDLLNDQNIDAGSVKNLQNHLVLFLSNANHFVNQTQDTDQVRRSISFNTFWTGLTGVSQESLGSIVF